MNLLKEQDPYELCIEDAKLPIVTVCEFAPSPTGVGVIEDYLKPSQRKAIQETKIMRLQFHERIRYYILTAINEVKAKLTSNKSSSRLEVTAQPMLCRGEISDGKGLSAVFFEWKGEVLECRRQNNWHPKKAEWIPKTEHYTPEKATCEIIAKIIYIYGLNGG